MVRNATLPHERQPLEPGRIVAISAAIAVNVAIFAVLMRPIDYTPAPERADTALAVSIIRHQPKDPLPVVRVITKPPVQKPHPLSPPIPQPKPQPVVNNATTPMSTHTEDSKPQADPNPQPPPTTLSTQPVETSLMPTAAPAPTYPRDALREGITGTVELELLVGVDGRVLAVTIMHSSGNNLLDAAAREQVLRTWRFQPALRDGIAVQSLGRVPIVFDLDGR